MFILVMPMWSVLYQLASPKFFYQQTYSWQRVFGFLAFFLLMGGMIWGLWFAPADYQQGDAFRIIYLHVPCAFLSMGLYAAMTFFAVLVLVWRIKLAGILLTVTAPLGAWMTFLALATGSIWGKPMWGTWWIWDARLTSELILLFLYLAILALQQASTNREQGWRMVAVFVLVGLVDLPIIHYSVYWWATLHQGASLSLFAKPKIALSMLYPMFLTLMGFSLYCGWAILHKARARLLFYEQNQHWVKALMHTDAFLESVAVRKK